jgi:holo-[acyl-carrier protein] synthase
MKIHGLGIDLIELADITQRIVRTPTFFEKILTPSELDAAHSIESKAGMIAAKEALVKAGYLQPGEWLSVQLTHTSSGKPFFTDAMGSELKGVHVSLSHTQHFVTAVVVIEEVSCV